MRAQVTTPQTRLRAQLSRLRAHLDEPLPTTTPTTTSDQTNPSYYPAQPHTARPRPPHHKIKSPRKEEQT